MTSMAIEQTTDSIVVELHVTEDDEKLWVLLAHMADYLKATFGVDFDCDRVVIGLVYDGHEDTPEAVPAVPVR